MKPSYNSGVQDGYIACGYAGSGVKYLSTPKSTGIAYDELHTSIREKGTSHHLITKLDLNGNVVWYVNNTSRSEFLSKVIQTSDGNYVVAGTTTTEGLEKYNPTSSNTAGVSYSSSIAHKRGYLAKYDQNGSLLWEYTYGLVSSSLPTEAAEHSVQLWNLLETEDGGIMSVGYGIDGHAYPHYLENDDSSYTSEFNLIAIFKTNANGILQWKKAIGGYTDMKAYGISRLGSDYIITGGALEENVGTYPFTTGSTYYSYSYTYVMKFTGSSSAPSTPDDYYINTSAAGKSEFSTDVTFDNAGDIIVPAVVEATVGYYDAHGIGKGKIYKLDYGTLNIVSTYSLTGLTLCAYDLKFGVCPTTDGGFAVTTSVKSPYHSDLPYLNIPDPYASGGYYHLINDGGNDARFWNNDVYCAKFNSSMDWEWDRIIDDKSNPAEYGTVWPANVRRAECVYDINQTEDGGFIIGGNNSNNFDDEYAIKIGITCNYNYNWAGHTITGAETVTGTKTALGTFTVASGGVLNINNANISFADTRNTKDKYQNADPSNIVAPTTIIVQPGGRLNINNSTLQASTSCGKMWDGIQIIGNPDNKQTTSDHQAAVYISNGSVIKEARYGVLLGAINYDSPIADLPLYNVDFTKGGGILTAVNSTFTNNYIGINSTTYRKDTKSIVLTSCNFSNTALLKDPAFATNSNERMGINSFVNLFNTRNTIVRGCSMTGYTVLDDDKRGSAIISNKSGLIVEDYYTGTITPFTTRPVGTATGIVDMTHAIEAYGLGIFDKTIVRNSTFKRNLIGITTDYADFIDIKSNTFELPASSSSTFHNPYAIFHHIGAAANIQNNTMSGLGGSDYGIVVRHSYRDFLTNIGYNSIDGAATSFQTEGWNENLSTKCNGFYNMDMGMDINPASSYGALSDQGNGPNPLDDQPLNLFDASATTHILSTIDFLYYNNTSNPLPALSTKVYFPTSSDLISGLAGSKTCSYSEPSITYDMIGHLILYPVGSGSTASAQRRSAVNYFHALLYEGYDADALEMLDSMHYIGADKILIKTYIEEGDYTKAQSKINVLNGMNLQDPEDTNFIAISQYLLNYLQGGGTLDSLTDSARTTLLSYSDTTLPSSGFLESIITDAHSPNIQQIPENGGKREERKANMTQRTITASDINDAKTFNIYPNPTFDNIILEFPFVSDKWVTITVMDNLGNILFDKKIENTGKYSLSTDALNMGGGMYNIKLTGEKLSNTRTFVKIND